MQLLPHGIDEIVIGIKDGIPCRVNRFGDNRLCQHEFLTIWGGNKTHKVEKVKDIPLFFGGKAGFIIENILAAVAAAYSQPVTTEEINNVPKSFLPSAELRPGRMNLFKFDEFDVMIDYAHNAAGFTGLKDFLANASYRHTVGIIASMGDRRAEDNREIGRLSAEIFDNVIICEDADLRGREPGEVTEIIKEGIQLSACNPTVMAIANEKKALTYAINNAMPGSFILHCTEKVDEILAFAKQQHSRYKKRKLSSHENTPAS